jgi:ferrous iron transport protein A
MIQFGKNQESESKTLILTRLGKKRKAKIVSIGPDAPADSMSLPVRRLRQMGFAEDREIEILHTGPFGMDPIAVRIDRMILALRRAEAALVTVKPLTVKP